MQYHFNMACHRTIKARFGSCAWAHARSRDCNTKAANQMHADAATSPPSGASILGTSPGPVSTCTNPTVTRMSNQGPFVDTKYKYEYFHMQSTDANLPRFKGFSRVLYVWSAKRLWGMLLHSAAFTYYCMLQNCRAAD